MPVKYAFKKHTVFTVCNIVSVLLLIVWIFKSCICLNSTLIGIVMDFSALLTCMFSVIRVGQSFNGKFKTFDMITIYYASLFFTFVWFIKMLYLFYDHFYEKNHDDINLAISVFVFITLLINFYILEKINLDNIEKIKSNSED